ncbi:MAG: hypothetical protein JW940_29200 [Polyangiaceae bacterium]|nr:hypothetical protein [Polyangiaceae bacterium]
MALERRLWMARMDVAAVAAVVISALSALGCSDPPEPPARGGLKVQFSGTGQPGETCTLGNQATGYGVGGVEKGPPADDGSDIGSPIISGEEGTDITCTVSKNHSFRATISAPNISLDLRGTIGQSGSISAYAPSSTLNVIGDRCTFDATPPYAYYPGEMFIHFTCPGARNPHTLGTACDLSGNIVVLRCAQ